MNKTQLVDALAARMGDRRGAATAVDCLLQTIVDTVQAGDSVSITGFGVFEARARAARVARNPRTGEIVNVAATTVPAFRPGAGFRTAVAPAPAAPPAKPARRSAKASSRASFAATEAPAEETPAPAGARKPAARAKGRTAAAPKAGASASTAADKKPKKGKAPAKAKSK